MARRVKRIPRGGGRRPPRKPTSQAQTAPPPSNDPKLVHPGLYAQGEQFVRWVHANGARILAGIAVLLAVGVAFASHSIRREHRIAAGFAALDTAAGVDDYLEIASKYAGTLPGEQAAFRAGRAFLDDKKFDRAASQFRLFLKDYPKSRLAGRAKIGLAYALEGEEKWTDAEKAFIEAATSLTGAENIAEAYLGAGRCAEAGSRLAQAVKWYEAAVAAGDTGYFRKTALDALKAVKLRRASSKPSKKTRALAKKSPGATKKAKPAAQSKKNTPGKKTASSQKTPAPSRTTARK